MRVVPPERASQDTDAVIVGGRNAQAGLVLSNELGAGTADALLADTNAEIVLAALRSTEYRARLARATCVSAERCDADTLLGVWAVCDPQPAIARSEGVANAARAGAFRVWRSDEAAQFDCWVRGFREQEGLRDETEALAAMAPLVAGVLDDPRAMDLCWIGEFSDLIRDTAMLNSGAVQIEEYRDLDLSVMETPLWLHDLVRLTAVSGFRLLTVRSENTFVLEYRRESGVRYQSRRPLPRRDLRPLAARLNLFERNPGGWRAESLEQPAPRLFFDNGRGGPSPSTIAAETVIDEVLDFFRAGADETFPGTLPFGGPAGR